MTFAIALALLWIGEGVAPLIGGLRGSDRWRTRIRHLVIAGINGAVAASFAAATLFVTELARANGFGMFNLLRDELSAWWAFLVLHIAALIALDAWHYTFHVLAHKVPVLWRFHVMHHNAHHLEATVAMRFHAAEIAVQCLLSLPIYALLGVTIFEVLLYQVVLLPVAMFHHADVRMAPWFDRLLRVFIVTPDMHRLHHSRWEKETDSNFAAVLSVWDRLFGSYRWRHDAATVDVGIDGFGYNDAETLRGMLRTGVVGKHPHAPGEAPQAGDVPRELRRRDRLKDRRRAAKE
jgi:sterol desaturase/sphingolipid hydroxylase (fatty acid hydroxylase superfamily)